MPTPHSKIAIITGGSLGLGRNTALNLAKRGVDIIFTYHSHHAEAKAVQALIEQAGVRAIALALDTGDTGTFAAFVERVKDALVTLQATHIDYLVNNAGISHHNSITLTTEDELDALYRVHVKGVFFLTQHLLPMIRDGGSVVNISSGLTRVIYPGSCAYGAMNGAVEIFTRYLAKELGPRRIRVNVVAPGSIQTDFSGGMVRDNPAINKAVSDMTALGRPGLPDDIGPMIASLLSEENRWVNAQRIEVSGGMAI